MYTEFNPKGLLDSGLGDLEAYQKELQAKMMRQQPQMQPQQSQENGDLGFLEKAAIVLFPEAYQNVTNVSTQRRNQANAPRNGGYADLANYWADKDPAKAQQYLELAKREESARSEGERQRRMQSVLGGSQAPVSGNAGYSQQAEQLARAGIQLMQQGDLAGGQQLIAQAKAMNELRTKAETQNLGDRVAAIDPYAIGQNYKIGVSPDSQLSAATARRGQDIGARTAAARLAFDKDTKAAAGASTGDLNAEAMASAQDALNTVGRIESLLDKTGTTGVLGTAASYLPFPTDRRALEGELDSLRSVLSFGELARLRAQGVTLGSVSEKELQGLADQVAKLDANMPEATLKTQLDRIKTRYERLFPGVTSQSKGGFRVIGEE